MNRFQQKQQEQQQIRDLLNTSAKDFGYSTVEERVQRCRYLQYEEHQQIFAVSYNNIHQSCAENSLAGVKYFLSLQYKRDKKTSTKLHVLEEFNKSGMAPLHYAAERGSLDVANFLLDEGCNINIRSFEGNTPLIYAAKNNQLKMIKLLIERRAELNYVNKSGMNCIHFAAQCDHSQAIRAIVEAVGNAFNPDDTTRVADDNESQLGELPSQKSQRHELEENESSRTARSQNSNILLQAINQPSNNKTYPLHLACSSGADQCVELLLKVGANPNATDSSNETPLHRAAKNSYYHLYRLLMVFGADDSIPNIFRETPADCLVDANPS
jgi:ankyrin repeat protein